MYKATHKYAVIDIETAPLPDDELDRMLPKPSVPEWHDQMFDPLSVKTGNLKDPKKINEKISAGLEKAKAEHQEKINAELSDIEGMRDKAALKPYLGWVFGVGVVLGPSTQQPGSQVYSKLTLDQRDEPDILRHVWEVVGNTDVLINHNLIGFDLQFLVVRSMINGVEVPFHPSKLTPWSGQRVPIFGKQHPVTMIDTLLECKPWAQSCKLNWLAHFFGLESKLDLDGKLPWEVAREDFQKAVEYTEQDVLLTEKLGKKMQLIPAG